MSRPLLFPRINHATEHCACAGCGGAPDSCECVVTCGRCFATVWANETTFYGWLGRDGQHVCSGCEHEMRLGGRP